MLALGIASRLEYVTVSPSFEWIGSTPALVCLAAATVIEIGAYLVPWLDHALDVLAAPAAVIAGTLVTASVAIGLDPWLKWTLAVIAGGGLAGAIQVLTIGVRAASTATTAGLGNPVVAAGESAGSIGLALTALVAPVLGFAVALLAMGFLIGRRARHAGRAP